MKEQQEHGVPPLPHQIRFAIQAFRNVKPSRALEARVFSALGRPGEPGEPAEQPSAKEPHPSPKSRLSLAFAIAGGVAVLLIGAIFGVQQLVDLGGQEVSRSEELAVKLPKEGHRWIDLPLSTHRHPDGRATVSFDAPASVEMRLSQETADASREMNCTEGRCVHRWSAESYVQDGMVPRVQIKDPGRYEFTVTHTSPDLRYNENFVIRATR